jgi:hypothetical protein
MHWAGSGGSAWPPASSRQPGLIASSSRAIHTQHGSRWASHPLPAKRKCRVSHLAEAYAALTELLPITTSRPPNHDQLQAIVGGLPGLAIEEQASAGAETETHAGSRIVGQPPRWEGGYWREGFIALPLPPKTARSAVRSIRWTD